MMHFTPQTGSACTLDYLPRRRDSISVEITGEDIIIYLMLILFIIAMSWMSPSSLPCMEMSARQLRDNVEMAFNRLDTNKDGVLTREEFANSFLMVSITE